MHYKYVYDSQGNIVRSLDIFGKKVYNYLYEDGKIMQSSESNIELDANEIVISKTFVCTVRYYYDAEGNLIRKRIKFADGKEHTVLYEQAENDSQIVRFTAGDKTVTSHSKTDSFGRKVFDELQLGAGFISRQFHYHEGEVTDEHMNNDMLKSTPTTQLVSQIVLSGNRTISYEYDAEERITKVTDSVEGVTEYTYDALGQLLTETKNGEAINQMLYDNYGNILQKNGIQYVYDEVWEDKLIFYNGQPITYDAQGNPTEYLGHELTWEKGRQLKSFDNIQYTYNANGIRTSKTIAGNKHVYTLDGAKILKEVWDNGDEILEMLYDNEENICGVTYNETPYFFQKNLQGDIIAITDNTGKEVARYSYDAWGKCTVDYDNTGYIANINPFRYRGYYFDTETGLYYLNSRYYDADTGRFINADSPEYVSIQGGNLFTYCGNCPTKNADYFGFCYTPTYPESYVPNNSGSSTVNYSNKHYSLFRISTWIVSTALDVLFALLNYAMVAGYLSFSATIWALARSPITRDLAIDLIKNHMIPVFVRGFYNFALTCLRTVLRNSGIVVKEFAKGWAADKVSDYLEKKLNENFAVEYKIMEFITSILTWGGIIALTFDIIDGEWDGYITF